MGSRVFNNFLVFMEVHFSHKNKDVLIFSLQNPKQSFTQYSL